MGRAKLGRRDENNELVHLDIVDDGGNIENVIRARGRVVQQSWTMRVLWRENVGIVL